MPYLTAVGFIITHRTFLKKFYIFLLKTWIKIEIKIDEIKTVKEKLSKQRLQSKIEKNSTDKV